MVSSSDHQPASHYSARLDSHCGRKYDSHSDFGGGGRSITAGVPRMCEPLVKDELFFLFFFFFFFSFLHVLGRDGLLVDSCDCRTLSPWSEQ